MGPTRALDVHAYLRRVRVHALECNRRLPEPLPAAEVVAMAAVGCLPGAGPGAGLAGTSTTPGEVQRRRGIKSGQVRRASR